MNKNTSPIRLQKIELSLLLQFLEGEYISLRQETCIFRLVAGSNHLSSSPDM